MSPLVLATVIKLVVTPFLLDRAPAPLALRLPEAYAAALEAAQCGIVTPPSKLGPQAISDFAACTDQTACLGDIGRVLGMDLVIRGEITKIDTSYQIKLTVFDVHEYRVRKHLQKHYDGKLSGLEAAAKEGIEELCRVIDPDWKDPATQKAIDALAFDPGSDQNPSQNDPHATVPAARPVFEELPPMTDPPVPVSIQAPPVPSALLATPPTTVLPAIPQGASAAATVRLPPVERPIAKPQPFVPTVPAPVPVRRLPVATIVAGSAVALLVIGIGFGAESNALWSRDRVKTVHGLVEHSIRHTDALAGNRDAATADVFFGLATVTGVAAGVMVYMHGGLGIGGHF